MAFNNLGDLLYSRVRKKGLAYQVEASMVLEIFMQQAVKLWGEQVKEHLRPLYVKDQTLTVAVLSSPLAQELKLQEKKLIESVNEKIGREAVIALRFLS